MLTAIEETTIPTGMLVRYTPRENEPPVAAIVMGRWDDGKYQLYVFHFEAVSRVHAADSNEVEPVIKVTDIDQLLDEHATMRDRLTNIENDLEQLRATLLSRDNQRVESTPISPVSPDPVDLLIDSADEKPVAIPVVTEQRSGTKKAWPK